VALAAALAGCGGGDDDQKQDEAPVASLPPDAVARVGEAVITTSEAQHWIEAARRQGVGPGACTGDECRKQAMRFLVSAEWLLQEAERRGIVASESEVDEAYEKQRGKAFRREEDYRKFLEESGRSLADLRFQVKLSVLTNKLQEQVAGRGAGAQKRLDDFVAQFQKTYSSKTVCLRAYSVGPQCGRTVG
jgi:hypothetical protein